MAKAPRYGAHLAVVHKRSTALGKALDTWDVKGCDKALQTYATGMEALANGWQDECEAAAEEIQGIRAWLADPQYAQALEAALREAEAPLEGDWPEYAVGPYRLEVDIDKAEARLVF